MNGLDLNLHLIRGMILLPKECLQATGPAMRNSGKSNGRAVIKGLRETITTDVVNEEIL